MTKQISISKFNLNDRTQCGINKYDGTIRGIMIHNAYNPEEILIDVLFVYDNEIYGREWISENSISLIKK